MLCEGKEVFVDPVRLVLKATSCKGFDLNNPQDSKIILGYVGEELRRPPMACVMASRYDGYEKRYGVVGWIFFQLERGYARLFTELPWGYAELEIDPFRGSLYPLFQNLRALFQPMGVAIEAKKTSPRYYHNYHKWVPGVIAQQTLSRLINIPRH